MVWWCAAALSVQAQETAGLERLTHWAYSDAVSLVGPLRPHHVMMTLSVAGMLGTLSLADEEVGDQLPEHYRGSAFLDVANELGNKNVVWPTSAALVGVSLLTRDRKFQDAAFTSLQALLYTQVLVGIGKTVAGRARPFQEKGSYHFTPFRGDYSFPSGHTATAFAAVVPWVMYYPGPVTYGLVILSGGTAVARMARKKHWLTDVVAGGAIGFMTAYWLSMRHLRDGRPALAISPALGREALLLQVRLTF